MKKFIVLLSVIGLVSLYSCNNCGKKDECKNDSTKVVVTDTIKPVAPVVTPTVTPTVKK